MSKSVEFTFSQMLRHAFLSGAGYGDLEKISAKDQDRWMNYAPPENQYDEVVKVLRAASQPK